MYSNRELGCIAVDPQIILNGDLLNIVGYDNIILII